MENLLLKDAIKSNTFLLLLQDFDYIDGIVEDFVKSFKIPKVESLHKYRDLKENHKNFAYQLLVELTSLENDNNCIINKMCSFETFLEKLPKPSSNNIKDKINKGMKMQINQDISASRNKPDDKFKLTHNDEEIWSFSTGSFNTNRPIKQIQFYCPVDLSDEDQKCLVDSFIGIVLSQQIEIVYLNNLSNSDLKRELKRGETEKIPLFLIFDEIINQFLKDEDEEMRHEVENLIRQSTIYRHIYREYLEKFNNTRCFLFTLVDLTSIDFQHTWLLHESKEEDVASNYYIDPVVLSDKVALNKFFESELDDIYKRKNSLLNNTDNHSSRRVSEFSEKKGKKNSSCIII